MEHDTIDSDVARRSALVYLPFSLGAALLFYLAASRSAELGVVELLGGTFWVGFLSLIVSMPVVTSRFKKAARRR